MEQSQSQGNAWEFVVNALLSENLRRTMGQRVPQIVIAVIAIVLAIIRGSGFSFASWHDALRTVAPVIWYISLLIGWHLIKSVWANHPRATSKLIKIQIFGLCFVFLAICPGLVMYVTWPTADPNAPRHFSNSQKRRIVAALSPFKGQKYTIDYAMNDGEALRFAEDLRDALNKSEWQIITYVPMWAPTFSNAINRPNYYGVQWFISERAPSRPATQAVRQVLRDCCNLTADGVRWPDHNDPMDPEFIYFWVGARLPTSH